MSRAREIAEQIAGDPIGIVQLKINANDVEEAIQAFACEIAEKIRGKIPKCYGDAEGVAAQIAFKIAARMIEEAAGLETKR